MRIDDLTSSTLISLKQVIDANNVIGSAIRVDGATVIPVSKVSFGFVSGLGEYSETEPKVLTELPQAGGSGGGASVIPVGFIVIAGDRYDYVNIDKQGEGKWEELIQAGINLIRKKEED